MQLPKRKLILHSHILSVQCVRGRIHCRGRA